MLLLRLIRRTIRRRRNLKRRHVGLESIGFGQLMGYVLNSVDSVVGGPIVAEAASRQIIATQLGFEKKAILRDRNSPALLAPFSAVAAASARACAAHLAPSTAAAAACACAEAGVICTHAILYRLYFVNRYRSY